MTTTIGWDLLFARRTRVACGELTAILSLADATDVITFSGGFPAPETFPTECVRDMFANLAGGSARAALQYAPTPGLPGLRDALAARLEREDGARPSPGELLVTSGGIDALALLGRALLDEGDAVAVEAPTYLGAISAFRGYEADVVEVPIDAEGIDVDALAARLAGSIPCKLVYVIPDHQNPTGQSLSAERRHALVALCRHHGMLLVEDVAYRDLGAPGEQRPPSLWSIGPDVTVQIGTFSKIMFPGVRLGWAVGPAPVIAEMVTAKQNSDQCSGALGQCLAEEYLRSGGLDAQLPLSRALYAERREAMLEALGEHLPDGFRWTRPTGGFFVWVDGPPGLDTVSRAAGAEAAGVAYVPGAPFFPAAGRGTSSLRLSFSRADPREIHEGIRRLAGVLTDALAVAAPAANDRR